LKAIIRILLLLTVTIAVNAQSPKYEMRAVWLTTIGGIDWPHSYANSIHSIATQKRELTTILDQLQQAGFNTVLLQTRVRSTTIFPSGMEPWDGCLSGKPGVSPGYDALQFAIDECHKRGMQCHAWIVTIPVGKWNNYGCKQLRQKYPKLIVKIGDEGYMNPEKAETGDYLARFCRENRAGSKPSRRTRRTSSCRRTFSRAKTADHQVCSAVEMSELTLASKFARAIS